MQDADRPHRHSVFGLRIASAVPLPELPALADDAPVDLSIDIAPLPDVAVTPRLVRRAADIVFAIPDVARFAIDSDGHRIRVDPFPEARDRDVRLYLLGSALGAVIHLRGLLPLHANAVVAGGRAWAFAGHPGAGKSTLAAALHAFGLPLLSDDVCVIADAAGAQPMVQPGIPRLRLWLDALERSGRAADDLEPAFAGLEKYTVPLTGEPPAASVPLGGVFLLARADVAAPEYRPLRGSAAAAALIENTYRGGFLDAVGDRTRHFEACLALAANIPVHELARAWDPARLNAQADQIAAHLRALQ